VSKFAEWGRALDDRVMGRPVRDDRPLSRRVLCGEWELWSGRSRWRYVSVLAGMLALLAASRWLDLPWLITVVGSIGFSIAAFLIIAAEGRRRAREADQRHR
jgi:hypothetical protein